VPRRPDDAGDQDGVHPEKSVTERAARHRPRPEIAVELGVRRLDAEASRGEGHACERDDGRRGAEREEGNELASSRVRRRHDEADRHRSGIDEDERELKGGGDPARVDEVRVGPVGFERQKVGADGRENGGREQRDDDQRSRPDATDRLRSRELLAGPPREGDPEGETNEGSEGCGHRGEHGHRTQLLGKIKQVAVEVAVDNEVDTGEVVS
jgi:hypothetical protein